MEKRFPGLRVIATLYKVASVLVALLFLLLAGFLFVASLASSSSGAMGGGGLAGGSLGALASGAAAMVASGFVLLYGAAISLTLWAFAEGVFVVLAIEENTRLAAAPGMYRPGP